MKKIATVVCSNGLGHLRRAVQIAYHLKKKLKDLKIHIYFDTEKENYLKDWEVFKELKKSKDVSFINYDPYPRWFEDIKKLKAEKLLCWHKELDFLKNYDCVISDNFIEPLIYNKKTIISGSFLWHDLYFDFFKDKKHIRDYRKFCNEIIKENKPYMIVNKYFFYPASSKDLKLVKVGMLKSIKKFEKKKRNKKFGVLISFSAGGNITKEIKGLGEYTNELLIYVDRRVKEQIKENNLKQFNYEKNNFSKIHGIIGYASMGIITESLGTKTPLFVLPSKNPEIEHNSRVLEKLGLGKRVGSIEEGIKEILNFYKKENYFKYLKNIEKIDKRGIEETIKFILKFIREN